MNKIKFRAKRVDNNEWITGYYYSIQDKEHYILTPCVLGVAHIEVHKSTICQFIGFNDKNGKEIFNGDIIKYTEHDKYLLKSFTAEIRYIQEYACFGYNKLEKNEFGFEDVIIHSFSEHDEFGIDVLPHIEVIGNIHEGLTYLECTD